MSLLKTYNISEGRKKALIINVLKKRPGAEKDTPYLEKVLKACGFEVTTNPEKDNTISGIKAAVKAFKSDDKDVCCVLVFVMSHGRESVLFKATNGKMNFAKNIVAEFNNKNCPQFKDVPKVLLANFCRGPIWDTDSDSSPNGLADYIDIDGCGTYSELYVCYATWEDSVAFRGPDGTRFIQSFCEKVEQNANGATDIKDIMSLVFIKVNDELGNPTCRQCPTYHDTGFTGKLYLRHSNFQGNNAQRIQTLDTPDAKRIPPVLMEVRPIIVADSIVKMLSSADKVERFATTIGVPSHKVNALLNLAKMDAGGSFEGTLTRILQEWKSFNGKKATIPYLIEILEKQGPEYRNVIDSLQDQAWKGAVLLTE